MLYGRQKTKFWIKRNTVLILILLENALRHETGLFHYNGDANVLILILLENALRQLADYDTSALQKVLILKSFKV